MRRTWAVIGLVVLSAGALAGCGGGDDGGGDEEESSAPTTTEERISEDDWVDEAHDACVTWHEDGSDLADDDLDDEEYYGALADLAEEYRDTVADLGSPEGLEDEAEELVDAASAMTDVLADALDLIDEGEDPDDDQDLVDAFAEANDDLDDAADDADLDCEPAAPEEPTTTAPPATTTPTSVASVLDLEPIEPSAIIGEYGTDLLLDSYADLCFNGDMGSCDDLYQESPVDDSIYSYEGYGATCGGRLTEEHPGECVSLA